MLSPLPKVMVLRGKVALQLRCDRLCAPQSEVLSFPTLCVHALLGEAK